MKPVKTSKRTKGTTRTRILPAKGSLPAKVVKLAAKLPPTPARPQARPTRKFERFAEECPNCGNADPKFLQNNGTPDHPADTMLCLARVAPEDWSFAVEPEPDDIGDDGKVSCGMQWDLEAI